MIPLDRQTETYLDGAYWCSTVMSLLDFDGTVKYVWNPFSLAQLKEKLNQPQPFDVYLECVASKNDATCVPPTDPIFDKQQIPLLSVYQRCLTNYQEQFWDPGSFILFNATLQRRYRLDLVQMPSSIEDRFSVADCLLSQQASGADNSFCLRDRFLRGTQSMDFFAYTEFATTDVATSDRVDACLTFSGPARSSNPTVSTAFLNCLESNANSSGCDIPHMLWSGRSTNKVPVATQHAMNISDGKRRLQLAQGEMDSARASVARAIQAMQNWDGIQLKVTLFSTESDLLHQYTDCVMMGPMDSMTLTPGPLGVEKAVWARNNEPNRTFQLPCTGKLLENRDGQRDDASPFTCGTYPRRAVIKHFLRKTYGGTDRYNEGARMSVVHQVQALLNRTQLAWGIDQNFLCTCPDGVTTGWACCEKQADCATEACPCAEGGASVACCTSVCQGLNGNGLMQPFSYIPGSNLSQDLLTGMSTYLKNDVWVSNAPWLLFDPQGAEAYADSWTQARYQVEDAGLFDASRPVVYYDEITHPFKSTFWEHCTGLLQQVIWTMPMDRKNDQPKGMGNTFDPINGQSMTTNLTYMEDFIKSLTLEAYKSSPVYWHYNVRHAPSQSEMCQRTAQRPLQQSTYFNVDSSNKARLFGFSSMTLGGLGGADCFCGWWDTATTACRIPDELCAALVQILGFTRICVAQRQVYNASDHRAVLASLEALLVQQPTTTIPCPILQVSEHWGFINQSNGLPWANVTSVLLSEGAGGFRVGNVNGLFAMQNKILNHNTRIEKTETSSANVALQCNNSRSTSVADLFVDQLFPSAQGVRQSMPQSYCTRYGIELARMSVYAAATLTDAVGQQQAVVNKWRMRCQYKLEELAVCNSFRVYDATGGPTDTSQCPFSLSVSQTLRSSYAVTPGCLVVLWNSNGQDGIYDPCVCVPCSSTPTVDVPNMLTTLCLMASFQSLVAKDVIPSETTAGVPLGSGSFESLMHKQGAVQVNTQELTHWALHTDLRDADLIADWWPDSWRYPAGYHVTAGCSRPGDAHWKTFDASWRWDSKTEQMTLAKDETNDPLLGRDAFGASGVCRANNYGMPMTGLNTMTVCTKENSNAKVDPTVPLPSKTLPWADSQENCAPDALSTPWNVNRLLNPPRQWSVGALQKDVLSPTTVTEWGDSCGPYPLQTCVVDGDCASGLTCVSTSGTGVCGYKQTGKFECTNHAQCNNDLMCAGDGLCVSGVWQIENDISMPISFRTYSQTCPTGAPLDTWGTSVAELVPDILSASGLCSYRSWFENRRMADRNYCNRSDTCPGVDGMRPWNFSSPYMQDQDGVSAFENQVLRVQAHPCDRDYQYLQGFVSCTPGDAFFKMYDQNGNALNGYTPGRDNRTRTYRVGYQLPLMHHVDELLGPTYGFTGVPKTYADLGLGQPNPTIIPCAQEKICGLQPANSFKVNNMIVDARQVLASGIQRIYSINDLLACGVFGYMTDGGQCRLDYAIVPLAYVVLNNNLLLTVRTNAKGLADTYIPDNKLAMLTVLQGLPELIIRYFIGGRPTTLQDYITMSAKFIDLYNAFSLISMPKYDVAGTPMQLYNTTQFGALEVPFGWWYKCTWLSNIPMGSVVVDETQCWWNQQGNASQPTEFGSVDRRLTKLFGMSDSPAQTVQLNSLLAGLIKLPGIITQSMLDQAKLDYVARRVYWIDQTNSLILDKMWRKCYLQREFVQSFSDQSQDYQLARLSQVNGQAMFNLLSTFRNDVTNATVCSGAQCLVSTGYARQAASQGTFAPNIISALSSAITSTTYPTLSTTQIKDVGGKIVLSGLFASAQLSDSFWLGIIVSAAFANLPDGCSTPVTKFTKDRPSLECICFNSSSCGTKILATMLDMAGVAASPMPTTRANLLLGGTTLDVCNTLKATPLGTCYLNDSAIAQGIFFPSVQSITVPVGVVAELYQEKAWDCVQLSCTGTDTWMNGGKVPIPYTPTKYATAEKLVIDVYEYDQIFPNSKANPWVSIDDQVRDLTCARNTHRYDKMVEEDANSWSPLTGNKNRYCVPSCDIPFRLVNLGYTFRLRTMNISYFKNNRLVTQLELYPCVNSDDTSDEIVSLMQTLLGNTNSFRTEKGRMNYYPFCSQTFDQSTGLPKDSFISTNYLRYVNSNLVNVADQPTEEVFSSIKTLVSTLMKQNTGEICLTNALVLSNTLVDKTRLTCQSSDINSIGSISVQTWSGSSATDKATRASYCNRLKEDPFFGCIMYPGEQTLLGTAHYLNDPTQGITCPAIMLAYDTCLVNTPDDPCRSIPSPDGTIKRHMGLTGATLTYALTTTAPDCTMSGKQKCYLMDEIASLASVDRLSFCSGVDATTLRFQDYSNLNSNAATKPNTDVVYPPAFIMGDPISRSTYSNPSGFSHMFLGLDTGYQCCPGCPQDTQPSGFCSDASQMAVQMRTNLWRCLDCPMVSRLQCQGVHGCLMSSPVLSSEALNTLDGWNTTTQQQQAFLTGTDSTIDIAAQAIQWLMRTISALWIPDVRLSYAVPAFMTSFSSDVPYVYNPLPILQYDAAMQINAQSCQVTGLVPDFTNCSYDSHRRNLRQFATRNYKTNDGIVIQPRQTLQWALRRSQLTAQNIPHWETNISNRNGMFLTDLFDDKWCLKGTMVGSACYKWFDTKNSMHLEVLNPSLMGVFEPSVGCDTAIVNQQRVVSAVCSNCRKSNPNEYNTAENGFVMPCGLTSDAVQRITVDNAAASNLCSKTPSSDSTCTNQHGMLGQTTYDSNPIQNNHVRQQWNGGLPAGVSANPLLKGGAAPQSVSNLVLSPNDIGGHFIRMVMSQTKSGAYAMSIRGLPLSSYPDPLGPAAYALGTMDFDMTWTRVDAARETNVMGSLYPSSVCKAWDCPLRRRAFWMGLDTVFRPMVPDPLRTQILYGTRAHPTQKASPMPTILSQQGTSSVLGRFATFNGFCACATPPCVGCALDIDALRGLWTASTVLPQSTKCTEQLDWPYAGGTLRDGSSLSQRWTTTTPCGVLDRLPVFQYRYKDSQRTRPTTKTTLDKGGVCHMGWPAVTAGPLAGCYLLVETDNYMCPTFTTPKNVTRLRAKTISEMLNSPSRARLTDCSAPPTYRLANNTMTAPEVSYGQPRRWEASRLLANDLRRRLCGNSAQCKPSKDWTLATFWESVYMRAFPPIPQGNGANLSLWSRPWVACGQSANGTQTCEGVIDRVTWATGDRPKVCLDTLLAQPISRTLAQDVDVCNMDASLDAFCRAVQGARYRVFEANCQYSGQCRQKLFFYQPSTYHVDNSEFVRSTVQTFYNSTVAGSCVPDQDTAEQMRINAQTMENCAAVQLDGLVQCIQVVRVIVSALVELALYAGEIMLNVFQLLGPMSDNQKTDINTQISTLLVLIENKFMLIFKEIGDLFYEIFTQGPIGGWIIDLVQKICSFIEWLFSEVVYVVLCWVNLSSVWVLQNIVDGLVTALNAIAFNKLGYLHTSIDQAVVSIQTNIPCTPQRLWSCNIPVIKHNRTDTTLPLPTRCWAGVEPGVNSLACTAADTCLQQGDYSNVICGACPVASSMTRFGCDTLTKLCSCNVFPVGISSCTSHQDCTIDDPDVSCRYVDSYLQPSYGNVLCNQCPKPMCLIAGGSSAGRCSCLLRPVSLQTCSTVGLLVSPDASALCLLASEGSSQLASSNAYTVNYGTLLSVPCILLNQASMYCMAVFTSATVSTPLVVGLSMLHTRRRLLLAWGEAVANGTVFLTPNVSVWEDAHGEPCRSLALFVPTNGSSLGLLEKFTLGECWRWYDVGSRLVSDSNMSHVVSPFILVSWRDLLDAMLAPGALVEILAKLPIIVGRVMLHSEYVQPAYLLIGYWSSIMPRDFWLNKTVLDQAAQFLHNASAGPVVLDATSRRRLLSDAKPPPDNAGGGRRRRPLSDPIIDSTVSGQTAYEWSQGPYAWPPNFVYWDQNQSCAVASTVIDVVKNGLDITFHFYSQPVPDPLPSIWPNFLPLNTNLEEGLAWMQEETAVSANLSSIAGLDAAARSTMSGLARALFNESSVRTFLTDAPYMSVIGGLVRCNFTRVQTCAERRPLLPSVIQSVVIIALLIVIGRALQLPYVEVLLVLLATPIFLWVAYGYSPSCTPLVPSCLMRDLVEIADGLLPSSIQWPAALTTAPGCESVACMRSCTADPVVGFADFNDHLAWTMCELGTPGWAIATALASMDADNPIRMSILRKCVLPDLVSAQRICFASTLVNSLPLLIVGIVALSFMPSLFAMAVSIVQCVINTLFNLVLYVHTR